MNDLTCLNCGIKNKEVKMKYVYIGGQGDVRYPYCQDETNCWKRRDKQIGLPVDFTLEVNK